MTDLRFTPPIVRPLQAIALAQAFLRRCRSDARVMEASRTRFYNEAWKKAAAEIGASYEKTGGGFARISLNGHRASVCGINSGIDDAFTLEMAGDKLLTNALLKQKKLPVPDHYGFTLDDLNLAHEFLRHSEEPCVVKPARGTGGGRAVTTGVRTSWQLVKAAAGAAIYGDQLIIERQIAGDNFRLLYLDGQLLHAFIRKPPQVVGDGKSTIAQLVDRENKSRVSSGHHVSQVLLSVDDDMRHTLASQAMTLRSIPAKRKTIKLKTVVNQNSAADNLSATHLLCDSVIMTGALAAAALGVRLAGVDLITSDPSVPLEKSGGVVLEVNTTPGFYFHYGIADAPCQVAAIVLRKLLEPRVEPKVEPRAVVVDRNRRPNRFAGLSLSRTEAEGV